MKSALTTLLPAIAGVVALGLTADIKPATAAVITYDFTVDVTTGQYLGKYDGQFSFDTSNPLLPCPGTDITCATPAQNGLKVSFNFLGTTFTTQDDIGFTQGFPAAYFFPESTTIPYSLSFIVAPPTSSVSFAVLGGDFYVNFPRFPTVGDSTQDVGTVAYTLVVPTPPPVYPPPAPPPEEPPSPACGTDGCATAVPEPSEVAGSVVAMGILGAVWRLRRKRFTPLEK